MRPCDSPESPSVFCLVILKQVFPEEAIHLFKLETKVKSFLCKEAKRQFEHLLSLGHQHCTASAIRTWKAQESDGDTEALPLPRSWAQEARLPDAPAS